jgi:hypothetical protein
MLDLCVHPVEQRAVIGLPTTRVERSSGSFEVDANSKQVQTERYDRKVT